MSQCSASPARTAYSTLFRFRTGRTPGMPRQTGQTWVFGDAPNFVGQPQKIFESVRSWQCTSSPITGSQRSRGEPGDPPGDSLAWGFDMRVPIGGPLDPQKLDHPPG